MNSRFKRLGAVICTVAIASTVFASSFSSGAAAPAGRTYYVATTGDNGGDGSKGKPFQTIQKAASVAGAGDTVIIAGGEYRESVTFDIRGTSAAPVLFKAAEGEEVAINGTDLVTGTWTRMDGFTSDSGAVTGDVYKIKTEMDLGDNNQLFIDGDMQMLAQWPDRTGGTISDKLMKPDFKKAGKGTTATDIYDNSLPNVDLTGATMVTKGRINWRGWASEITKSAANRKSFSFVNRSPYAQENMKQNVEYYVINSLKLLNRPGEWYYDKNAKELYVCVPGNTDMSKTEVEKKVRNLSLSMNASSYVTLENIDLFGSNMTFTGSSSNCNIDGMKAEYITHQLYNEAVSALQISGTNNGIWNSEIAYSFGGGITTYGNKNKVINSVIHDINYGISNAGFLSLYGTNEVIFHNTGYNGGRSMCGGNSRGSRIAYNEFYNAGMLTSDCGLIYFGTSDGGGTEIDHNAVHDNKTKDNSMGIYFDCGVQNYSVHHNLMYNVDTYGFSMNVPSQNMLVFNNTVYNTSGFGAEWGHATLDSYINDQNGTYIANNLVANTSKKSDKDIKLLTTSNTAVTKTNIVTDPGKAADNAAKDLFKDPENGDFTLRTDGNSERNIMARTGGTPLRNVTGETGYIGCYDPSREQTWKAGHSGTPFDRTQKKFFGEDGELMVDLDNPLTDLQYKNNVSNGSFEGGLADWKSEFDESAVKVAATSDPMLYGKGENGGKESTRSARGAVRIGNGVDGLRQKVTGLRPYTRYILSAWIKLDEGQTAALGAEKYNGTDSLEVKTTDANGGVWKRHYMYFTTGKNTSADIYLRCLTRVRSKYVYFDDIAVQEVSGIYAEDFDDGSWEGLKTEPSGGTVEYRSYPDEAGTAGNTYAKIDYKTKFHLGELGANFNMTFKGRFNMSEKESQNSWMIKSDGQAGNTATWIMFDNQGKGPRLKVTNRVAGSYKNPVVMTEAEIAAKMPSKSFSFSDWHTYTVVSGEAAVKVLIDGTEVLNYTDTANFSAGTYIWNDTYLKTAGTAIAEYDDIVIKNTEDETVYTENFEDGAWDGIHAYAGSNIDDIQYFAEIPNRYAKIDYKTKFHLGGLGTNFNMTFKGRFNMSEKDSQNSWMIKADDQGGNTATWIMFDNQGSGPRLKIKNRVNSTDKHYKIMTEAEIAAKMPSKSFLFSDWHAYTVVSGEAAVKVLIDGTEVLNYTDTANFNAGTYIWNDTYSKTDGTAIAEYDDIVIKNTEGETVYAENFEDEAWDGIHAYAGSDIDSMQFPENTVTVNASERPSNPGGNGDTDDRYAYLAFASAEDLVFVDGAKDSTVDFKAAVTEGTFTLKLRQNAAFNSGVNVTWQESGITVYKGNTAVKTVSAAQLKELLGGDVSLARWHTYKVALKGSALRITMDGAAVLELTDSGLSSFAGTGLAIAVAGKAGLDNLTVAEGDTGTVPDPVDYVPPTLDTSFTPLVTREQFNNFESMRWGGMTYEPAVGGIVDSGDPEHNYVFKIHYGDWKSIKHAYPMHNAVISFDAKIDPNGGEKSAEGYFVVAARLFGNSNYAFRVAPKGVYVHKTNLRGNGKLIEETAWNFPEGYDVNDWHTYSFLFDKNLLELYVDGNKVASYIDNDQPLYFEDNNIDLRLETRFVSGMLDNFRIAAVPGSGKPDPDPNDSSLGGSDNEPDPNDSDTDTTPHGAGNDPDTGASVDTGVGFPTAVLTLLLAAGAALPLLRKRRPGQ